MLDKLLHLLKDDSRENVPEREVILALHQSLNIIDGKATGLLTIDALFTAVAAIFMTGNNFDRYFTTILSTFAPISLLLLLGSACLCLFIMRLEWKFLEKTKIINGNMDARDEINELIKLHERRYYAYIWAWWLSAFAIPILFIVFVLVKAG